jgi:hypothetical protein
MLNANPTPITPPRVALLDQRTGLIERSWYMFFLSLFRTAQDATDPQLVPDTNSLIASYDAALLALAQETQTQPPQQIIDLPQDPQPRIQDIDFSSLLQDIWPPQAIINIEQLIQDLLLAPRYEPIATATATVVTSKFYAYQSTPQTLGAAAYTSMTFPNEVFDTNSEYNTGTSQFVPLESGYYQFTAGTFFDGATPTTKAIALYVNGSSKIVFQYNGVAAQCVMTGISPALYLNAGDAVSISCYAGIADVTLPNADTTFFGGNRVL